MQYRFGVADAISLRRCGCNIASALRMQYRSLFGKFFLAAQIADI
jgi:hypothetical protein